LGLDDRRAYASNWNLQAFYQCYNNFAGFVDFCVSSAEDCREGCGNPATGSCLNGCDLNQSDCGADSTHYFSNCLYENVFSFEMEHCPSAPEAAFVCDGAYESCLSAADGIEDEQAVNSLVAECMDSHYDCLQKSGIWQCY